MDHHQLLEKGKRRKPKVMQVLYSGLGGHGSVFVSLIEGDDQRKVDSAALFFGIEEIKPEYVQFCTQEQIPFYFVKKEPGEYARSWQKVFKVFEEAAPDVLLLHSVNLLLVALWYCRRYPCKLIVVEHNSFDAKIPAEWAFSGIAMLLAPKIVLLTTEYEKELTKKLGPLFNKNKIAVINNGINCDKYQPVKKENLEDKKEIIISMIGRFTPFKDQKNLVEAFAELLQIYSGTVPLKLHLAGSGESLDEVIETAQNLGLQESVVFPGLLSEPEVISLLQKSDVYVHASLIETMSTSVMQALSVGLPVIGTDIPGINNIIKNQVTGLLYPPGDTKFLARQMYYLLQHPAEAGQLGLNAREYAVNNLSHQEMFEKYSRLY